MAKKTVAGRRQIKTSDFEYEGYNKRHEKIKGEISAFSVGQARMLLDQQGIKVLRIKKKAVGLRLFYSRKVKAQEISLFTRQMATLTTAGIPLVQAFSVTADAVAGTPLFDLIQKIKADVESGVSFSQALRKYPQSFDDLYCSLVEAGEQSGTLETMLDRLATYQEKIDSLKRKVKKALYYPTAVIIIAAIVTTILMVKVVPTFKALFESNGAKLPGFTQLVVNISDFLRNNGLWVLGVLIIVIGIIISFYRKSVKFRHTFERLSLRIPIIGPILQKSAIARFSRTLATTTKAGVPLTDALDTVAYASGNIVYSEAVLKIKDGIASGQQMRTMMKRVKVFPSLMVQMVSIGEESGALEEMLGKVANLYEDEVNTLVDGLTTLLEPIIMVILGVIVGGLVISMYLPIFQMGSLY